MDFTGYLFWGGLVLVVTAGVLWLGSIFLAKLQARGQWSRPRKPSRKSPSICAGLLLVSAGLVLATAFFPSGPAPPEKAAAAAPSLGAASGVPPFGPWREQPPSPTRTDAAHPGHMVGIGSWYGKKFEGRRTASGEVFRSRNLTLASRTLPLGARVEVTNLDNGRRLTARINDRGPYIPGRSFDVSRGVARELGFQRRGLANLKVRVLPPAPRGQR